jgi:hypothetical protein
MVKYRDRMKQVRLNIRTGQDNLGKVVRQDETREPKCQKEERQTWKHTETNQKSQAKFSVKMR